MLQSALKIEQIVDKAKKLNMPAVAMTDRNNLFGMLEFSMAATKEGIQPIHGAILDLELGKDAGEILLLAKNQVGYSNLLKLVSHIYTCQERRKTHTITFQDLEQYQEGLIILSGYTDGLIGKALIEKKPDIAEDCAKKLHGLFGNRFYFEIMRHGLDNQQRIEVDYIELAYKLGIPLVATNSVLFANIEMHAAHDVLLCIAAGLTTEHADRKMASNQCYLKSPKEMVELFKDLPEAIENSVCIAKRCSAIAQSTNPMLPKFADGDEEELLRRLAREGLETRLFDKSSLRGAISDEATQKNNATGLLRDARNDDEYAHYFARLEYELDIICKMDFPGYFLIVSDFIKWSKENGISVGPGRGSGAGSIVAWSLLITDLDPIRFGLLFERFLNPERVSMPDFDIDFCQERRDEVIKYVRQRYGDNRVGQIITFGKMQAKAVIKDVSRVLGLGYSFADYLTELVPFNAVNPVTLEQAIRDVAELKGAASGKGLYNMDGEEELIKQVLDTALSLEGLHRHASVHAAGIVIGGKDLVEILPVYKDPTAEMLITQYSMKYAEAAGLVKFDFLGLQTLTVIAKTCALLKDQGVDINPAQLALDDPKTYELLSRGEGAGVFQFESVGMRDTLRRMRPDAIEDLIALGALYRPGPMDNIPTYIACKHGKEQPNYLHPAVKDLLKETYGVIVYQEQVLEIAKILAGYTLGAADLLRRAMGKKIKAEMDAQEKLFIDGAEKNGIDSDQAKSIFATVEKFAGYGFNKSHAAAYGMISYQTAYLKANHTAEFLVACLNLDIRDSDKINLFIQEAARYQIDVVRPDINLSEGGFSLGQEGRSLHCHTREGGDPGSNKFSLGLNANDDTIKLDPRLRGDDSYVGGKTIIFALGAIKNVTGNFGVAVKAEREKGPFKSIVDLVERMDPKLINKRLLENLIKAGCFDSLHDNRNALLESVPKLLSHCNLHHAEKRSMQISLMNLSNDAQILSNANPLPLEEQAFMEFDVLGSFLSYHPISTYSKLLEQHKIVSSDYVKNHMPERSSHIKIAGVIQKKDSRMSQRGRFVTLQLSDQHGNVEVTIFSEEVLKNYVHLLSLKSMVVVSCDAFKDEGGFRLTATSFASLDDTITRTQHNLKLKPKNPGELESMLKSLKSCAGDKEPNSSIEITVPMDEGFVSKVKLPPLWLSPEVVINLQN